MPTEIRPGMWRDALVSRNVCPATRAANDCVWRLLAETKSTDGNWWPVFSTNPSTRIECWQFDETLARSWPVNRKARMMSRHVVEALDPVVVSDLGLPPDTPTASVSEVGYVAGHLVANTRWWKMGEHPRLLSQREVDLGMFPYPSTVSVTLSQAHAGVATMPIEISYRRGAPPITLNFESPYGCFLGLNREVNAMTFVGDACYAFTMPVLGSAPSSVTAHRVTQESNAMSLFEWAQRILRIRHLNEETYQRIQAPGWTRGATPTGADAFSMQSVASDPGLTELFSQTGEMLVTQLDTMIHVLSRPAAEVVQLYRNFVPDNADAALNAHLLIELHRGHLTRHRTALVEVVRRQHEMTAIADFDVNRYAALMGLTTGTLDDVRFSVLYGVPLISIARHLVQNVMLAPGTHAANVARERFADTLFHECGHAAAMWVDSLIPKAGTTMAAPAFRGVYFVEDLMGGTVDLASFITVLRESTLESVVNLASFNHLMRMLLCVLDTGRANEVIPGLLDGSANTFSYEYLASMLTVPLPSEGGDADLLSFLDLLYEQGLNTFPGERHD